MISCEMVKSILGPMNKIIISFRSFVVIADASSSRVLSDSIFHSVHWQSTTTYMYTPCSLTHVSAFILQVLCIAFLVANVG